MLSLAYCPILSGHTFWGMIASLAYLLGKRGYVFSSVGLSVCLSL